MHLLNVLHNIGAWWLLQLNGDAFEKQQDICFKASDDCKVEGKLSVASTDRSLGWGSWTR
jgi:hypothetical protein